VNPLLLPIVAGQGIWVRSTIESLPAAAGPDVGTVGDGSGQLVRVAVVGESTAAGCGVDSHADGFGGCLARELAARTGQPVGWQVVGQHGATAHRIRHELVPRLGGELDVAVLLAGVNDVLTRRAPRHWGDDLAGIVDELLARAERVVVCGVPPFQAFPSLPTTLRRYLAQRATALDEVSQQVCARRPRASWLSSADILPAGQNIFARDGFHPSGIGYRYWAAAVAGHLDS
jgi:lysophospholipase L1-like esterase